MRAHLSKFRKLMPSLALLFALIDGANVCTLSHAQMAAAWCAYLESHARRVYSAQVSSEEAAALSLGYKLAAGKLGAPGSTFHVRDVYKQHWTGLGTPEEARTVLAYLEQRGWVRKLPTPEGIKGRKSEIYVFNPRLEACHVEA